MAMEGECFGYTIGSFSAFNLNYSLQCFQSQYQGYLFNTNTFTFKDLSLKLQGRYIHG
jgi:hypothetical protein